MVSSFFCFSHIDDFSCFVYCTDLRYPFSLFLEARDKTLCKIERIGNVVDELNKGIGRSVININGSVSANNYVDFQDLFLCGNYLYVQCNLLKSTVATFHLELVTSDGLSLRVTVSTLYSQPRFLGRSLRLPLPKLDGWMIVMMPLEEILTTCCDMRSTGSKPVFSHVKVRSKYWTQFTYLIHYISFLEDSIVFNHGREGCGHNGSTADFRFKGIGRMNRLVVMLV